MIRSHIGYTRSCEGVVFKLKMLFNLSGRSFGFSGIYHPMCVVGLVYCPLLHKQITLMFIELECFFDLEMVTF